MKPALLIVLLTLLSFAADAQKNFFVVRDSLRAVYESQPDPNPKEIKQFERWNYMMAPRVYPSGDANVLRDFTKEVKSYKLSHYDVLAKSAADWKSIGPHSVPSFARKAGRSNCLAFHPSNPQIMWMGMPNGGLWKTTNGGGMWNPMNDLMPNLGVSAIVVDPTNPDILYVATGDGFGYSIGGDHWGGTYSNGVMKSTDGGLTFNNTGLNPNLEDLQQIFRLTMNQSNPQILLATTNLGIYRTTDGGDNWSIVRNGEHHEIISHPTNPDIMYAVGAQLAKSTDAGASWFTMANQPGVMLVGTEKMAVTPDNPDAIYLWGDGNVMKTDNDGNNWVIATGATSWTWLFVSGWYMGAIAVNPNNENDIIIAGVEIGRSLDNGQTVNMITDFYDNNDPATSAHVDVRDIVFSPHDPSLMFVMTDGGIFSTPDFGDTWYDLNTGVVNTQLYKMANSDTDADYIFAGAQDQGHYILDANQWDIGPILADGMECVIHPMDENIVYANIQYGNTQLSTDRGVNFEPLFQMPSFGGYWVSPMAISPNTGELFLGADDLYKTANYGVTWTNLTNGATMFQNIGDFAIYPADDNTIYVSTSTKYYGDIGTVHVTHDHGTTWQDITVGLPVQNGAITALEVSHNDPNRAWASISGFSDGEKVYETTDGGITWTNISGTLPNIPVNCIERESNADNAIYIGTDMGVFYKDDTMTDWAPFINGLPNVIVTEIEVLNGLNVIRACTYGRGIWESHLYGEGPPPSEPVQGVAGKLNLYPNPTSDVLNVSVNLPYTLPNVLLRIVDQNGKLVRSKQFLMEDVKTFNVSTLADGMYFLQAYNRKELLCTLKFEVQH